MPFEVVLDEVDPGNEVNPGDEVDPGDEEVGDIGVGMEGVAGVETGVEVGKRLPRIVGWWAASTLPIGLCLKRSVEDGEAPWGLIVRVRVSLFVPFGFARELCKCLAEDVVSKAMTVVYRVAVPVVVMVMLTGLLMS